MYITKENKEKKEKKKKKEEESVLFFNCLVHLQLFLTSVWLITYLLTHLTQMYAQLLCGD